MVVPNVAEEDPGAISTSTVAQKSIEGGYISVEGRPRSSQHCSVSSQGCRAMHTLPSFSPLLFSVEYIVILRDKVPKLRNCQPVSLHGVSLHLGTHFGVESELLSCLRC